MTKQRTQPKSTLGQTNYHPYPAPHNMPAEIDLAKLSKLELGAAYIKDLSTTGFTYNVFGAIIASTMTPEEEFRMMAYPIKFKLFAWEYEPMKHIRWTLDPGSVKAIEAEEKTKPKESLTKALKLMLKGKLIKLRDDQMELAEEFGLASI